MAITWNDVTAIATELATLSVTTQDAILAQVAQQQDLAVWGDQLDSGAVWLAAHLGTLARRAGRAGAVSSESVGQVSRSYQMPAGWSRFDTTSYGQEYERRILQLPAARWTVA